MNLNKYGNSNYKNYKIEENWKTLSWNFNSQMCHKLPSQQGFRTFGTQCELQAQATSFIWSHVLTEYMKATLKI